MNENSWVDSAGPLAAHIPLILAIAGLCETLKSRLVSCPGQPEP